MDHPFWVSIRTVEVKLNSPEYFVSTEFTFAARRNSISDLYEFVRKEYESILDLRLEQEQALKKFYADVKIKTDAIQALLAEDKYARPS